MLSRISLLVLLAFATACSSESGGGANASSGNPPPTCNPETEPCGETPPVGTALGTGDGSPGSVTFTEIYNTTAKAQLVDLAFLPKDPTQLWVIGYGDDSVYVGSGVTAASKGTWKKHHDPAAIHFMHKPPAIAMGENGFWGTCGDNANEQNDPRGANEPNYFMGPALFTSDLEIFTTQNVKTGLGSHYDMLHNTSMCRGIAHMEDNWFWTFNGQLGSLEKYNFAEPHEPGGDDHSDGEIYRYAEGQVKGVDGVSSHIFYDAGEKVLYIADTGNKRIAKLDTTQGKVGARLPLRNEPLEESAVMEGTTVEDVVPPGTLEQPSGIEVHDGHIYVTDTATATFHMFDKTGKEIRKLETGLEPGALSGFTFGPDKKIWFTDRKGGRVFRIDTERTGE